MAAARLLAAQRRLAQPAPNGQTAAVPLYSFRQRTSRPRFGGKEPFPRKRRRARWGVVQTLITIGGLSAGALIGLNLSGTDGPPIIPQSLSTSAPDQPDGDTFTCRHPVTVDGDTLRCGDERVRLHGIDAPEKPGSCRPGRTCVEGDPFASTEHLRMLAGRAPLTCTRMDIDSYGRTVARCEAGGVDLSCAQIEAGHAARRYGHLACG